MNICRKILLIAGDNDDRESLYNLLLDLEYDVSVSPSIDDAKQKMSQCLPAMILFHMNLLDAAGSSFLNDVKEKDEQAGIVVILISEKVTTEEVLAGLELGVEDFIEIPFNQALLQMKLQNYLKWRDNCRKVDDLNNQLSTEKNQIKEERDLLAKYFSQDLIDFILSGSVGTRIGGNIQTASIMFCDMRNSTTIAEKIGPAAFMDLINNLFTDLTDLIYGEGGSVNKFIGDGILATFGCPKEMENDALHCATVALKIRKYMENFNQFRPKYLTDPIQIGVGISRGKVFSGNVGSVYQIQYTVLGDPVNIASRLENLSKRVAVDILMDGNIRVILGKRAKVKRVNLTRVRGKLKQIKIFYLESILS